GGRGYGRACAEGSAHPAVLPGVAGSVAARDRVARLEAGAYPESEGGRGAFQVLRRQWLALARDQGQHAAPGRRICTVNLGRRDDWDVLRREQVCGRNHGLIGAGPAVDAERVLGAAGTRLVWLWRKGDRLRD